MIRIFFLLIVFAYEEVVYLPRRIRRWWWYRKRPEMKRFAASLTKAILDVDRKRAEIELRRSKQP